MIQSNELEIQIQNLEDSCLLSTKSNIHLFLTKLDQTSPILNEIGRLREIAYNQVGEGSGNDIDVDKYDLFFYHLFLWDSKNKCIVGAYRLNNGLEIYNSNDNNRYYLSECFTYVESFKMILKNSLELGRLFIRIEYQKQLLPLAMLWKGVLLYLKKNPQLHFIIGSVSISNKYSNNSQNLMLMYLKKNYFNHKYSKMVLPKNNIKMDNNTTFTIIDNSISWLDMELNLKESGKMKPPILLKKYLQQNASVINFNRDANFSNSIDVLMILETRNILTKTLQLFNN